MLVTSRGVTKERIGFFRMDIIPAFDFDSDSIPSTPGIYAIVNRLNQHIYVGSAVNLLQRKQHHFSDLKAGKHKNPYLQRAYDSYGQEALLFGVIEHVSHVEDLLVREQYYIDTLNPEYNIARTAGSNLGMTYSPETKAKMRAARLKHPHMREQMAKLGADRTGKKLSPEHRAKITANQTGRKLPPETIEKLRMRKSHLGHKHSPEAKAKMRAAKVGRKQSPEIIEKRLATRKANREKRIAEQQSNQLRLF